MTHGCPSATPRLHARWWTADDAELAWLLWGDPEVMRYMGGPQTPEQVGQRLARQFELAREHGVQYWAWFAQDEFVGACGLKPCSPGKFPSEVKALETGFHLRPQFWGQGYGAEMARAVLAHAFGPLSLELLWAGRHPHNEASGRLLTKLGFQPHEPEFYPPTGLLHPGYILTAEDYRAHAN